VVEATLDIGGFPVVLGDTAGIRNTPDLIEKEGIERAAQATQNADVVLFVLDGSTAASEDTATALQFLQKTGAKIITIVNKADLPHQLHLDSPDVISVSCKTRSGIDGLYERLAAVLKER
jgi:tRNA modification GTPase